VLIVTLINSAKEQVAKFISAYGSLTNIGLGWTNCHGQTL